MPRQRSRDDRRSTVRLVSDRYPVRGRSQRIEKLLWQIFQCQPAGARDLVETPGADVPCGIDIGVIAMTTGGAGEDRMA